MDLKQYRKSLNITIEEASTISSVPLRTYIRYENDESYGNELKRKMIFQCLKEKLEITETKGIYNIEQIKELVSQILGRYGEQVDFCYLFGSYAKGYATESSDIDLCVSTSLGGLKFVELLGDIKSVLKKNIDLIRLQDLTDNLPLVTEIMKDGLRIYEQSKK